MFGSSDPNSNVMSLLQCAQFVWKLYQPSKVLTLFCKATAAVILFCLIGLIREIGDGWGGQATAGFRGGRATALCSEAKDGAQACRLLALAAVHDGMNR